MSIINKKIKDNYCEWCGGLGCKSCNYMGFIIEYYSYYIDDKKKIAFGSEQGK